MTAVFAHHFRGSCNRYPDWQEYEKCHKCTLLRPRHVTLVVRNTLKEPTFQESVTLRCTRFKTLFFMMQEAADINPVLR